MGTPKVSPTTRAGWKSLKNKHGRIYGSHVKGTHHRGTHKAH